MSIESGTLQVDADRTRVSDRYQRGALSPARWRRAIGDLYTREARWWAVLGRATVADHAIPLVYIAAVNAAQACARREATTWAHRVAESPRHTNPDRVD